MTYTQHFRKHLVVDRSSHPTPSLMHSHLSCRRACRVAGFTLDLVFSPRRLLATRITIPKRAIRSSRHYATWRPPYLAFSHPPHLRSTALGFPHHEHLCNSAGFVDHLGCDDFSGKSSSMSSPFRCRKSCSHAASWSSGRSRWTTCSWSMLVLSNRATMWPHFWAADR